MLLTHDKFSQFTPQPIADAKQRLASAAVPVGDSRESVDLTVDARRSGRRHG